MLDKLMPSSGCLSSLHLVLKFVSVKSGVTKCYFIWQLLMEALFFQEDAHSTYGHLKTSSFARWRKQFGIRRKHWNVRRLKSLQFFWTSLPSRSGSSNLKAFVCLFVQPIYFDYTVYSSEEGNTYPQQRAFYNETIVSVYGSSRFLKFGKKGSGNGL